MLVSQNERFGYKLLLAAPLIDITPDRIFSEYHKVIEFFSEVTSYQNVFSLRPRSSSAITKKLQEIKDKLKVDEELFKKQIQYNWFFD